MLMLTLMAVSLPATADIRIEAADTVTVAVYELRPVVIPTGRIPSRNLFVGLADARLTLDMRPVEVKTERKSAIILFIGGAEAITTMKLLAPDIR
jgi:hypothetical protein